MAVMNTTTFLGDKPIHRMGYGAMQLASPFAALPWSVWTS